MFAPITIVQVRKPTKVTVPAGGWVLIGTPAEPLADQIARRAALLRDGNVSDDYAALVIGRIQDSHTPTRFITSAEKAGADKQAQATQAALTKSDTDAKARQKKHDAAKKQAEQDAHDAKVAEINKEHAANAERAGARVEKSEVQLETVDEETAKAAKPPKAAK